MSRQSSADYTPPKSISEAPHSAVASVRSAVSTKDKDLHGQIEDLLTALSEMQREQAVLAVELQREREEREEDRLVVRSLLDGLRKSRSLETVQEEQREQAESMDDASQLGDGTTSPLSEMIDKVDERFSAGPDPRRSSILQTKHQLRDELARTKEHLGQEVSNSQGLSRRLDEQDQEANQLREQLKDARSRLQESHRDNQRLQQTVQDFRARKPSLASVDNSNEVPTGGSSDAAEARSSVYGGLRELKLGRSNSKRSQTTPTYSKRTSSLSTQAVLATENHEPVAEDALLLELVNAKTAEALARQELEEVKGKLDSLRRMLGHRPSPSESFSLKSLPSPKNLDSPKLTPPAHAGGGFWGAWGKRSASTSISPEPR